MVCALIFEKLEKELPALRDIKAEILQLITSSFEEAFVNDLFKDEKEIHPYYEQTFQPDIFRKVEDQIRLRF